jgi:uncharacterized protein
MTSRSCGFQWWRTIRNDEANAAIVRRMFEAFAAGDVEDLRHVLAPDAVWHIPGSGIASGDHQGVEAIVKALTLARSSPDHDYRPELIDIATSDRHAIAVYKARGERHGKTLELDQLVLMRIEDGIVVEVTAYPRSQSAFDEFWA